MPVSNVFTPQSNPNPTRCPTAAATGIGLAYSWYARPGMAGMAVDTPRKLAERFATAHRLAFEKWRVDEFYDATVLRASRGLGLPRSRR